MERFKIARTKGQKLLGGSEVGRFSDFQSRKDHSMQKALTGTTQFSTMTHSMAHRLNITAKMANLSYGTLEIQELYGVIGKLKPNPASKAICVTGIKRIHTTQSQRSVGEIGSV